MIDILTLQYIILLDSLHYAKPSLTWDFSSFLAGPPSDENEALGIEKLKLKTQVCEVLHIEVNLIIYK